MKSTKNPPIDAAEVDRILGAVKRTWKASIARDDVTERTESEQRLARATSHRRRPWLEATPLALCAAACIAAVVYARRPHAESIVAEPPEESPPAIGAAPSIPVSAASSSAPSPPPPPPAPAPKPAKAKAEPSVLPRLPPPESPPSAPPPKSKHSEARALRHAREALENDRSEPTARETLRQLVVHAEPHIAFAAARTLARSFKSNAPAQVAVWDEVLRRPLPEPYQTAAREERARAAARLESPKGPVAPLPPVPPRPPHR